MNARRFTKGFTLFELLIAISIFSVMATMAYGGLRLVVDGNQQIEKAANSLASLQRAFLLLQQDLQQMVPRATRDEFGSEEAAFVIGTDGNVLQLTRGGANGLLMDGADLRRVEYHLNDGRLDRVVWSVLDRVQDSKSSRLLINQHIEDVNIQFLGYEESEWKESQDTESNDSAIMPRAVEVTITTEEYGAVTRIFVVGS